MYWLPYSSHTSHHPSQTPCLRWISYVTQKLTFDSCKIVEKQSEAFHTFLCVFCPSLKENFIAYRSSEVNSHPDYIFEVHELWQSGFSRVYSNCCCSYSFDSEIIRIGQLSHTTMYSNNILNFQEFTTILNACSIKVWKLIESTTYAYSFSSENHRHKHSLRFNIITFSLKIDWQKVLNNHNLNWYHI